ncbi:MAG: hypothetical protein AAFZ17_04070 [Cyanobacteria bacterium J06650_10]
MLGGPDHSPPVQTAAPISLRVAEDRLATTETAGLMWVSAQCGEMMVRIVTI